MANHNAALLDETAESGTMNNYGDRFLPGEHIVALDKAEMAPRFIKSENDHVTIYSIDLIVLSSTSMKPGTRISEGFFIGLQPMKKAEIPKKKLNGFGRALLESIGVTQLPEDADGKQFNAAVSKQLKVICEMDPSTGVSIKSGRKYPGRGVALRVVSKGGTSKKLDDKGQPKTYVNNDYSKVEQTKEEIKARRAAIQAVPAATDGQADKPATGSASTSAQNATSAAADAAVADMLADVE